MVGWMDWVIASSLLVLRVKGEHGPWLYGGRSWFRFGSTMWEQRNVPKLSRNPRSFEAKYCYWAGQRFLTQSELTPWLSGFLRCCSAVWGALLLHISVCWLEQNQRRLQDGSAAHEHISSAVFTSEEQE